MKKIQLNANHWAGILLLLLVISGFIFPNKPADYYKLSAKEMLRIALAKEDVVTPDSIRSMIEKGEDSFTLVDLRTPMDYVNGHIDDAVNIPLPDLLEKGNQKFLKNQGKTIVLYADDEVKGCAPWMLLKQLGYKNVKVMLGGYNYYITGKKMPKEIAGKCYDEQPRYNYVSYFKGNNSITQPKKTLLKPVVPRRKKKPTASGGC